MEVQGMSVAEIRLGRPRTHYYLRWEPTAPGPHCADHRARLDAVRTAAGELEWHIHAAGGDAGSLRLVFRTTTDNLERGLAALLRDARDYRVYMVQPAAALSSVVRCVHATQEAGRTSGSGAGSAPLPEIHYGLFMGERAWAARTLDLLIRRAAVDANVPPRFESLSEVARMHDSHCDAIAEAYRCGRFSLKDIADYFGMHFSEVSAIVNTRTA